MQSEEERYEDELMDSLLHEHARKDREQAIREIENAIMKETVAHAREHPALDWKRLIISGSVAAAVVLCFGYYIGASLHPKIQKSEVVGNDSEDHSFFAYQLTPKASESKAHPRKPLSKETMPKPPSSASARAITSSAPSEVYVPMPELSYTPSVDFGAPNSFGQGWGNGGGGGGQGFGLDGMPIRGGLSIHEDPSRERYSSLVDQVWQSPLQKPLSTFSIDVDNASYSNIRRLVRQGSHIPEDAVRIEECINAFDYRYPAPQDDSAFAVHTELTTCPWNQSNLLVKVGIKGREVENINRPASNLVFLIDVSGSMQSRNKLPLVQESLKLLLHQLDERDSVSYVVYAGTEGVVLPPTRITEKGRVKALEALEKLRSGGSTNGGAGIKRAYQLAADNFIEGGVNRVILASDGDFNVGVTGDKALVKLVKERAANNIYLSALAFGSGNLNDSMFEAISNEGNGNYFYIDDIRESRKVLLQNLSGTLVTIAKDVKIQVEFNPKLVGSYRLIGYANRVLKDEDFNNDKVDAGDIGAGHTVTAFYEVVPAAGEKPKFTSVDPLKYQRVASAPRFIGPNDEWLTLKLRHKHPEGDRSKLQEKVLKGAPTPWDQAGPDSRFATAVTLFGMKLRGMSEASSVSWDQIRELAQSGVRDERQEDRTEFIELIEALAARDE